MPRLPEEKQEPCAANVAGTLEGEKTPVLGMLQRNGEVVIQMLSNVQQATIQPLISRTIAPSNLIHTDEYDICDRLPALSIRINLSITVRESFPV